MQIPQSTAYASGKNRTFQLGIDNTQQQQHQQRDDVPFTKISFFDRNPQLKIIDIISSSISTFFVCLNIGIRQDDDDLHSSTQSSLPQLYGCGCNQFGQLSLGEVSFVKEITKIPLPNTEAVVWIDKISCGTKHSLLLTIHGDLYTCGASDDGQLSIQPGECVTKFTKILENVQIAKAMGKRTMIVTRTGQLLVCGENDYGQLGLGDAKNRLSLVSNEFFQNLLIQNNEYPIDLDGGISHTIIMTNRKRIFYFGNNFPSGTLKPTELLFSSPKSIKCTNYSTFVITERNKIYGCGLCGNSQLPFHRKSTQLQGGGGNTDRTAISYSSMVHLGGLNDCLAVDEFVVDIGGGSCHSCFYTNFGRVFICGKRFENGDEIREPIVLENPFNNHSNTTAMKSGLLDYEETRYYVGRSSFFVTRTLNNNIVNFKKKLWKCEMFDIIIRN